MNTAYKQPIDRLKRHMAQYQPQLQKAIAAIAVLAWANTTILKVAFAL